MEIYNEEQLSGIKNIQFFKITEITNWPVQVTDHNTNELVFNLGVESVIATVAEKSFLDYSKKKQTNSGDLYEISLKYSILTRSKELEILIENYQNHPGVAVVHYYSGFSKLFGTNDEPIFLTYKEDVGSVIEDKSSVDVEIQGITRTRPVYFTPYL